MDSFLIDLPLPSMGATVNEITVIDLMVAPGDSVSKGQRIAELESDKSAFDFESPCDGLVQAIFCRGGDIKASGSPFLRIETKEESLRHLEVREAVAVSAAAAPAQTAFAAPAPAPAARRPAAPPVGSLQWTPRALKIARDAGLEPEKLRDVPATGPGGRISGDDIERFIAARPKVAATSAPMPQAGDFLPFSEETVCVAGIGYAVPKMVRSNAEILKAFPDMTEEEIVKITGIRQRYYADETESATSLGATAVQHALTMAGMPVSELDGIIVATLIPDQPVPSAASALAKHLGLKQGLAFDLNAACSGWLYALEIGRAFIKAGTARRLAVVTAELLSRITNPRDHSTAFLFGDGAGAAILTDTDCGHRLNLMQLSGDPEHYCAIQRTGGGARHPVPRPGDNLDQFYLTMDGPVVFKHAVIAFANMIDATLRRHRMRPEDVHWIVPHQANERILKAVSKRVGIPFEKFVVTIGKYGNTSAASVSMALGWAAEEGIFSEGDRIIFCSVGAGFTYAGGLLTW
jgi:3-oxoacyl-(acyl-carrier-protein) synthase III